MKSKQAEAIRRAIIEQRNVSKVYRMIDRCDRVHAMPATEALAHEVASHHRLMCDSMTAGLRDPDVERVYADLLRAEYRICCDVEVDHLRRTNGTMGDAAATGAHTSICDDAMRSALEQCVEDIALASLQSDEQRRQQVAVVEARHYDYLDRLFNALLCSFAWTDGMRDYFVETAISSSVDSDDVAVVVSAVTLAAMNVPDVNKWLALAEIYARSNVERVRQRALVGWVLAVPSDVDVLFPEVLQMVQRLCSDPETTREISELQMQLFFCFNADNDAQEIHAKIIPSLRQNSNLTIRDGIPVMKEEDPLQSILHPEAEEEKMEAVERSMNRIADMQKSGSDIHFAAFSQMKGFPFFSKMMHWLVPFSVHHPSVAPLMRRLSEVKMIRNGLENSALCDSDKYSFAFGVVGALDRLTPEMRSRFDEMDVDPLAMADEETDAPTVIRRHYLQDLFRFFRLSSSGKQLSNPFRRDMPFTLFVDKGVFCASLGSDTAEEIARFLYKQKQFAAITSLARAYPAARSVGHRLITATAYARIGDNAAAQRLFDDILTDYADNTKALRGAAQAAYVGHDYSRAVTLFEHLLTLNPADIDCEISLAVARLHCGEDAMPTLFRLGYELPDDNRVKRAIGWGHLLSNEAAKACAVYDTLLNGDGGMATDYLNAGYANWFLSHTADAVALFQKYLGALGVEHDILDDFARDDALLRLYGITEAERHIMVDLID